MSPYMKYLPVFCCVSTLTGGTLTDSLAQAMYCEVLQDQAPFWENRTIPRQANAEILFFFSFILSCFLHFLFKEMSSQNESCPDNFTYLLCSSMMVPNCYL